MQELFKGIGGVQKNSFIDFPGTVSAVLFYNGCNLTCPYCHNPSLAKGTETTAVDGDLIVEFLKKRKGQLEGVVITGGEPTLYPTLLPLIDFLKNDLGYKVKLDSNGLKPDVLHQLNVDYLALDIKSSAEKYKTLLGASSSEDIESLLSDSLGILKSNQPGEVRITCAPRVIDKATIKSMISLLEGTPQLFLQRFHNSRALLDEAFFEGLNDILVPDIEEYRDILKPYVGRCEIR